MAHGKRYRKQIGKVQREHAYPPAEAIALIKETASAGFDETVELHLRLGVNVRHAEEQLRGTLALPHGLGKEVTIAVFAEGQQARDAEAAGADFVGGQDLVEKVEEGWTDFDVAISTPDMMKAVGQLGRVLGPQGKMPNPKVGTVTDDVEKAVGESKSGKVEYRTDRQAIIHMAIGKASFDGSAAARQLPRGDRRGRPRQAILLEGQIHPLGDADDDDGPGSGHRQGATPAAGDERAGDRLDSRRRATRRPPASRRRAEKPTHRVGNRPIDSESPVQVN